MSPRVFPLKVIHRLCCPPSPPPSMYHWIASCLVSLISDSWVLTANFKHCFGSPHYSLLLILLKKKGEKKKGKKNPKNQPTKQNSSTCNLSSKKVKSSGTCFLSMCIAVTAHLCEPQVSDCITRSKHTPDPCTLCIWAVQRKPSLSLSEWARSQPTCSQPTSKHVDRLTLAWCWPHMWYPGHPCANHAPAGRRNFSNIWLLSFHSQFYSEFKTLLRQSSHGESWAPSWKHFRKGLGKSSQIRPEGT